MSTLSVTTITTENATTPLRLQTGNSSGPVIALSSSNTDITITGNVTTGNVVISSTGLRIAGDAVSAAGMFRNRIINGDMRIDQRWAGTANTPVANIVSVDRWGASMTQASKYTVQQNGGSVTPPAGFTNYLGITSTSSYSVLTGDIFTINQAIEGYNIADFGWGSAGAQSVTLSFWVRSSLTGTFGGAVGNAAGNRSYPFSYTINSANTWEYKTITIPGDTTGSWLTTNGLGMIIRFGLGVGATNSGTAGAWTAAAEYRSSTGAVSVVGTSGATWYLTGVQLEAGSVATPFERRFYAQELALCQRYYFKTYLQSEAVGTATVNNLLKWYPAATTVYASTSGFFPVEMRIAPSPTIYSSSGASGKIRNTDAGTDLNGLIYVGTNSYQVLVNNTSVGQNVGLGVHIAANAEL